MTYTEIGSIGELRDLLGMPTGRAATKDHARLHAVEREWLAISPFCILATADADGNCDASLEEHYAPAHYSQLLY